MSTTVRTTATKRVPADSTRKTALVAGIFYVVTFVSIPTLGLYTSVKGKDFIISSGADTGALWGAFLEVIVALAGIGTAVTLFPVVKRQNEGMALGFVATRTLEAAMTFTGVASLLSLVTLRQDLGTATGANAASLITTAASHIATYNRAFTLGQSLMPGINALLLGTLMYRSGLVPRVLPLIGLIGAPLHLTAVVLTMFGVIDRVGSVALIAALPIAVWEFSLGVYLVVKGFKPCPIREAMNAASTPPAHRDITA
jgi:energy-converting hydrogenase Eha subunit E